MTPEEQITATTNKNINSKCELKLTLGNLIGYAQDFAIARLSTVGSNSKVIGPKVYENRLDKGQYEARAKRIAGTYARFYLETEVGGNPRLKGRHYWMALGAFASKTVACALGTKAILGSPDAIQGLARGNFWLFQDVASLHYFYNVWPHCFDDAFQAGKARKFDTNYPNLKKMPWQAALAPNKLNNLAVSSFALEAFKKTRQIEKEKKKADRETRQFEHLIAMADHEQRAVLQKYMYNDPDFVATVQLQRKVKNTARAIKAMPDLPQHPEYGDIESNKAVANVVDAIVPNLELVFSHACSTNDPKLKSIAPEDTVLENEDSRMKWIKLAAEKFHGLMMTRNAYMEKELNTMAAWCANPTNKSTMILHCSTANKPLI